MCILVARKARDEYLTTLFAPLLDILGEHPLVSVGHSRRAAVARSPELLPPGPIS